MHTCFEIECFTEFGERLDSLTNYHSRPTNNELQGLCCSYPLAGAPSHRWRCAERAASVKPAAAGVVKRRRHGGDHLPDDDVFYLFLQKQKIGTKLHIHLQEGTYHKWLFVLRGPSTNDMKK